MPMSHRSIRLHHVAPVVFLSLVAACAIDSPSAPEGAPEAAGQVGTRHAKVPFKTANGIIEERDVDVDAYGHVWIGDEGFGWINDTTPRSNSVDDLSRRWPGGKVNYRFKLTSSDGGDPQDIGITQRQRV